jgi:hypothetical protein
MKVKDTLKLDLVYATLEDKVKNFVHNPEASSDVWAVTRYVRGNFPSWQYNGTAKFDEVAIWCEEHFGNDWIWNFETIYFKREADKSAFLLRWS